MGNGSIDSHQPPNVGGPKTSDDYAGSCLNVTDDFVSTLLDAYDKSMAGLEAGSPWAQQAAFFSAFTKALAGIMSTLQTAGPDGDPPGPNTNITNSQIDDLLSGLNTLQQIADAKPPTPYSQQAQDILNNPQTKKLYDDLKKLASKDPSVTVETVQKDITDWQGQATGTPPTNPVQTALTNLTMAAQGMNQALLAQGMKLVNQAQNLATTISKALKDFNEVAAHTIKETLE